MQQSSFQFTLWDVGHGISIWIRTPSGHNHWIDTGCLPEFSPAQHVFNSYGVGRGDIDYLILSHPDKDHFDDLDDFLHWFGEPRVFARNKSVLPEEKFGSLGAGYQRAFFDLDAKYNDTVTPGEEPWNPDWNGGVTVVNSFLDRSEVANINDSSIVTFYQYQGWLFVMPGDIGDGAWQALWAREKHRFEPLVTNSKARILVAPHHGRPSGYSDAMIGNIRPHLIVISDEYGKEDTDQRFRTKGTGMEHSQFSGELKPISHFARLLAQPQAPTGLAGLLSRASEDIRFLSTKTCGRLQFQINTIGTCNLHIITK